MWQNDILRIPRQDQKKSFSFLLELLNIFSESPEPHVREAMCRCFGQLSSWVQPSGQPHEDIPVMQWSSLDYPAQPITSWILPNDLNWWVWSIRIAQVSLAWISDPQNHEINMIVWATVFWGDFLQSNRKPEQDGREDLGIIYVKPQSQLPWKGVWYYYPQWCFSLAFSPLNKDYCKARAFC